MPRKSRKAKQQVTSVLTIEGLPPGRTLQMKEGSPVLRDGKVIGKVISWNMQDALIGKIQVISELDEDLDLVSSKGCSMDCKLEPQRMCDEGNYPVGRETDGSIMTRYGA